MYSKQEFSKYMQLRTVNGDERGTLDMLDYPAVLPGENQEYSLFMNLMEEAMQGREYLVLQEYDGRLSPNGSPLVEMRRSVINTDIGAEDFLNPLDEPADTLPKGIVTAHTFAFRSGEDFCLVRVGHDKEGLPQFVRETVYDVTDLSSEKKNELISAMRSSAGYWYLDNAAHTKVKRFLEREGCRTGESLAGLYRERATHVAGLPLFKDDKFKGLREGTLESMDFLLPETGKGSNKELLASLVEGPVTVYVETEHWQRYTQPDGMEKSVCAGIDIGAVRRKGINEVYKYLWPEGQDMEVGIKGGDFALRSVVATGQKEFPDGPTVRTEAVIVARLLPTNRNSEGLAKAIDYLPWARSTDKFRGMVGMDTFAEWEKEAAAFRVCADSAKAMAGLIRQKVDEAFPQRADNKQPSVRLLLAYVLAHKGLLDKKLLAYAAGNRFRDRDMAEPFRGLGKSAERMGGKTQAVLTRDIPGRG